jgi:hypothetical protein
MHRVEDPSISPVWLGARALENPVAHENRSHPGLCEKRGKVRRVRVRQGAQHVVVRVSNENMGASARTNEGHDEIIHIVYVAAPCVSCGGTHVIGRERVEDLELRGPHNKRDEPWGDDWSGTSKLRKTDTRLASSEAGRTTSVWMSSRKPNCAIGEKKQRFTQAFKLATDRGTPSRRAR